MKSFLLKVLLFLLPAGLLVLFVEMQLRSMPSVYSIKKADLDKMCGEIEILCLGSSHTFYAINPVYFSKKGYNAAYISQTYDYDQKILEKYIDKMPTLQYVILPVSYFSFFEKLADNKDAGRRKFYSLTMQVDQPDLLEDYMIFGADRQELVPYWLGKIQPYQINEAGFGTAFSFDIRNKNIEKTGANRAKMYTISNLDLRQKEMKEILENMIRLCESQNIKVVLLITPTHQSYRKNLNQYQLNLMYSLLDNVRQNHKNIMVYDAFSDPEYITDDFFDADHLNDVGAKKFTEKLNQFLEKEGTNSYSRIFGSDDY